MLPPDQFLASTNTGGLSEETPFRTTLLSYALADGQTTTLARLDDFRTIAGAAATPDDVIWAQTHPQMEVPGAQLMVLDRHTGAIDVIEDEANSAGPAALQFLVGPEMLLYRTITPTEGNSVHHSLVLYDFATHTSQTIYEVTDHFVNPLAFDGQTVIWLERWGTIMQYHRVLSVTVGEPSMKEIAIDDLISAAVIGQDGELFLKGDRGVWRYEDGDDPDLIWRQENRIGWSPFVLANGLLAWTDAQGGNPVVLDIARNTIQPIEDDGVVNIVGAPDGLYWVVNPLMHTGAQPDPAAIEVRHYALPPGD